MAWHSGIGRYIREVAPRTRQLLPNTRWRWVGLRAEPWMQLDQSATEFVAWDAPIYSFREHFKTPSVLAKAAVRWVPHYNTTVGGDARLVATIHDLLPLRMADRWRGWLRKQVFRRYLARIRRDASMVLTDAKFTAQELAVAGHIEPSRIRVVPLGCNKPDLVVPRESDQGCAEPISGCYFVFVGNVKPHKNLAGLITAWADVAGKIPEKLVIVGQRDGFFTGDNVTAKIASQFGDRVVFTGHVSDRLLYQVLAGATALVQPSLYEGFGLPVLEAMSVGCPVLAANATALPEAGGDAAIYFQPKDLSELGRKLVELSTDEKLRSKLRAAGLERAQRFTWERTAELTAAVLSEVLEGRT